MRVAELRPDQSGAGRLLSGDGFLKRPRTTRRGKLHHGGSVSFIDGLQEPGDAATFECRDRAQLCESEKPELAVELSLELRAGFGLQCVPFVDRDHEGSACFENVTGD